MAISSLQLEAFYTLAQTGHFTRAAERLHITQSALSQRVLNLESDLQTAFFIRDRQGVRLTQEGLGLLRYCQAKEDLEEEFLVQLQTQSPRELAGRIRLGGFSSVMNSLLIPAVAPLAQQHSRVRLYCISRETYELPELLQRGEVDFIVLDHCWEREGIVSVLLGHEQNVLVERKGYRGPEIYLDHDEKDDITARYFKHLKKKWNGQRHFLDQIDGLIEGVKQRLGRAVLPRHLIEKEPGIYIIEPEKILRTPVYLHFYERPFYSKLHQATLEVLKGLRF
jgi:DNA-binding transcriptional LysR family regulator